MGVQGFNRILRDESYLPDAACCSTSPWRSSTVMDRLGSRLEAIPAGSHLLIDGNGLAFFCHRIAYARQTAVVLRKTAARNNLSQGCIKIRQHSTALTAPTVRRLLPSMLPLQQLSAVVHEFVTTLRDKHRMRLTVYWDGRRRRIFKQATETHRQAGRRTEWHNMQAYCTTGVLPPAQTVCEWGSSSLQLPKNRLFLAQIMHTVHAQLSVPAVYCAEEADVALAAAATGRPDTYILADDSDFCFFQHVQYVPLVTLDAASAVMTAVVVRRRALAERLGLPSEDVMVELAILLGNDYIDPSSSNDLSYQGSRQVADILDHLRCNEELYYRVTSLSEATEEVLRFVRCWYELEPLDDFDFMPDSSNDHPSVGMDDDDEAGDVILHMVSSPPVRKGTTHDNDDDNDDRLALPNDLPLHLLCIRPLQDQSAKDAVIRCLTAYLEQNSNGNSKDSHDRMITAEHVQVWANHMALDGSIPAAAAVQALQGDWRPQWSDIQAAYVIEKLLATVVVRDLASVTVRLVAPDKLWDAHKFHTLLHYIRQSTLKGDYTHAKLLGTANSGIVVASSVQGYHHQDPSIPGRDAAVAQRSPQPPQPTTTTKTATTETATIETVPATTRVRLPIDEHEERILASIRRNRITIIQGDTGCGKSSRLPVMILRAPPPDPSMATVRLYMSQPRRIAAKGLVERVRQVEPDLRDQIALRMGHGVREYETKQTRAWFVTTGYLVRLMANHSQSLSHLSHLIIDEVHERSVDTDILCLLCRRLLQVNDKVRLILMSATLAANLYQEYFSVPEPPLIVGAKRFPVREVYLDDLVSATGLCQLSAKARKTAREIMEECDKMKCIRTPNPNYMEKLYVLITQLVAAISIPGSSILVFVPGMNDIVSIGELIDQMFVPGKRFTCIPVHSDIPFDDQMKVFAKAAADECRVIVATNSAESSVTLPALDNVICLGLAKQITYNELSHRQMLQLVWISRASAKQRAGRTGRIAPGTVFRLYSRECFHRYMQPFEPGEMVRIPLDSVILALKEMMADDERVTDVLNDCLEPPNLSTIERSFESLHQSNFITEPDDDCQITTLGSFALALGIDLTLGSLIGLGIQFGVGREAIQMAAIFSFPKSPWQIPNPMLQSPNDFNAMTVKTYASKCDFDVNLFSEPLSIMNLLWQFGKVSSGKKRAWCSKKAISYPRISRLASTADNVLARVASFLHLPLDALRLDNPPSEMPQAKLTMLRVLQTWVFHDTMIQWQIKKKVKPDKGLSLSILPKSDDIDDGVLDSLFIADRHLYSLIAPKEIVQQARHKYEAVIDALADQTERRAFSYAVEKGVSLLWMSVGPAFTVFVSLDVCESASFGIVLEKLRERLPDSTIVRATPDTSRTKRGMAERACGRWTLSAVAQPDGDKCYERFSSTTISKNKINSTAFHMLDFMTSNPQWTSLTVEITSKGERQPNEFDVCLTSRGTRANPVSAQDFKDIVGASGEIDVKQKKQRKRGQVSLFFPDSISDENTVTKAMQGKATVVKPLLRNIPEAARVFSVLASRRRDHLVRIECENKEAEQSDSDVLETRDIYPEKQSKISYRWKRFMSGEQVFVDENSVPASAYPVDWSGTVYCCCANTVEVRGGSLKADGLTLLPLGTSFFLLCRVSFGLVKVDTEDDSVISNCLARLVQEGSSLEQEDLVVRLRKAASLHASMNEIGEDLVCLPAFLTSLLQVFDGLHGVEAKPWKTLYEDPFLSDNQRKGRNGKLTS